MKVYVLLFFFAMVVMCQAGPSNLDYNSLENYSRRLENLNEGVPIQQQLQNQNINVAVPNQQLLQNQKLNVAVPNQPQLNSLPLVKNRNSHLPDVAVASRQGLKLPQSQQNLRRYLVPAYGVAGLGAGMSGGIHAGLDAGFSAGIGAGGAIGGYGYGGLGYVPPPPYYG